MTLLRPYEYLFELVNDSVMTRTLEGRINFWNRSAEDLYGWSKEEAVGRVSHDLLETQFPKPLEEIESELVRKGQWVGKLVHTTRDGGRVVVESRWALDLKGESGAVVEINMRSTDREIRKGEITSERKQAQTVPEQTVMPLQQYEHLFELVNDSVMTRTMEGRINFWNRSAEELYGWKKEEAIGRVSHDLLETQFPKPLEEIESELVRNGQWEGKLVHTTRDGGRVVVESRWSLELKGQTGALVEISTPSTDHEARAGAYSVEIRRQEPAFVHNKLQSVTEALSNAQVRRTVPTVKRLVRAALRQVRTWLEEDGTQKEKTAIQAEQPLHPTPIALCAKILEHDPQRPSYVWGVVHGAVLAQALGIPRISVLELGVAGGQGLIALEKIAERTAEICGVQIDVYGFDSGVGLPKPTDHRDLPNLFSEGFFPMDAEKLRSRLKKAKLKLGLVEESIPKFLDSNPAPIAFIAFDLDLYSSTKHALGLFEADQKSLLPRVYCYFDDILGFTYSEFTGELLAIAEFNDRHAMRKISKINGLRYVVPPACRPGCWIEQFYMAHMFEHKLYGHYDGSNPRTSLDLPVLVVSELVRQAHDWMDLAR